LSSGVRVCWEGCVISLDLESAKSTKPQPPTLEEVVKTVAVNLHEALTKHELELQQLSDSRRRFLSFDLGSFVTLGTVSVVASSTANPSCR
jgi:hypothetical protein